MTFSQRTRVTVGMALLLGLASCRDEQAGPRPKTARLASPQKPTVLDAAPGNLTFRSGATWANGAVMYLGASLSPPRARAGQPVTVRHYFQALRSPPQGFQFFVHGVDATNGQQLANADHEIQGGALPLGSWPVGKVVEDVHTVTAPAASSGAVMWLIGFWQGDQRLPVDDPHAHDGQNRMRGPTLELDSGELPSYRAARAPTRPNVDGDLGDPAWQQAKPVQLVGSYDGRPTQLRTTARIAYDAEFLFVSFDCEDPDVWGTLMQRDEPIYNQEVVEMFIDVDGDGKTYNELQVSPNNVIFDAYFPKRREGMDLSFDSGMKSAVKVRGTVNNPSDRDEGWSVEMQIPLGKLANFTGAPKAGDRFRFNLYRLEHLGRAQIEGQAFSPLFVGDFHALPRFGWLVFE